MRTFGRSTVQPVRVFFRRMPNDVGTFLVPVTLPPVRQFCLLRDASGTAGAENESDVGFDTFALFTGVFGTALPSLMSVTVIGAWKFVPTTVIVAAADPGSADDGEPSWFRLAGEALVAVGWSVGNENGTEIGAAVHVRPGNVSSMAASVFPQTSAPPSSAWSDGTVTMIEVFELLVTWTGTSAPPTRTFATTGSAKLLPVITTFVDWVAFPTD